ncbi:MAG TPA: hypothetical protein VM639_00885 [Dongiaceae bacterium]|nr:hypothetical protein [Dongiaceae bacterium]
MSTTHLRSSIFRRMNHVDASQILDRERAIAEEALNSPVAAARRWARNRLARINKIHDELFGTGPKDLPGDNLKDYEFRLCVRFEVSHTIRAASWQDAMKQVDEIGEELSINNGFGQEWLFENAYYAELDGWETRSITYADHEMQKLHELSQNVEG